MTKFYEVGDNESGGLSRRGDTRETPAPQCTSTEPVLRSA